MKQFNTVKYLLLAGLLGSAVAGDAQVHPLAFPPQPLGASTTSSNYYLDYVGHRFEVMYPSAIAGPMKNTIAPTTGTSAWTYVFRPINNVQIALPPAGSDSFGCSALPAHCMDGKIGVIWRGPAATPCTFSSKVANVQNAGAIACIIIDEVPGEPIIPGSTTGYADTIPVFMVSTINGLALEYQFRMTDTPRISLTPWGLGYKNDLGFVQQGGAAWHAFAIPSNQVIASGNPIAYNGSSGAFIANFGSNPATHVKVSATLRYTPAGGVASVIHTDTTGVLATFNSIDSIYAMFDSVEYNISSTGTGTGKFDLTYNIISDSSAVEQYPNDNTYTTSFYTTSNIFSKGRYDFAAHAPICSEFEGSTTTSDYLFGTMYYVSHGRYGIDSTQFSMYNNANGPFSTAVSPTVYVSEWIDGSNGNPADGVIQNGEMDLKSVGSYTFNGTTDTSGMPFSAKMDDSTGTVSTYPMLLDSNAWYYITVDVSTGLFLGCDGYVSDYPRVYGRFHSENHYLENMGFVWSGDFSSLVSTGGNETIMPFQQTNIIQSIDSIPYASQLGLIPNIALITNNNPSIDTGVSHVGVKTINNPAINVSVFPNPATDYINVSVDLAQTAATLSYTVLDNLTRVVSKEVHNNVKSETATISTAKLAAGNYYMSVKADGKVYVKKFAVVR